MAYLREILRKHMEWGGSHNLRVFTMALRVCVAEYDCPRHGNGQCIQNMCGGPMAVKGCHGPRKIDKIIELAGIRI